MCVIHGAEAVCECPEGTVWQWEKCMPIASKLTIITISKYLFVSHEESISSSACLIMHVILSL